MDTYCLSCLLKVQVVQVLQGPAGRKQAQGGRLLQVMRMLGPVVGQDRIIKRIQRFSPPALPH